MTRAGGMIPYKKMNVVTIIYPPFTDGTTCRVHMRDDEEALRSATRHVARKGRTGWRGMRAVCRHCVDIRAPSHLVSAPGNTLAVCWFSVCFLVLSVVPTSTSKEPWARLWTSSDENVHLAASYPP